MRGKPSQPVLLNADKHDVLDAGCGYMVCYRGCPVALRKRMNTKPGFRYPKTFFFERGRALLAAANLNKMFKTHEFTVHACALGEAL